MLALGLGGGWLLAFLLRRMPLEAAMAMVLALTFGLALFGLAQILGTSGFLAIYLAGMITGATTVSRPARGRVLLRRASPGWRRSCCS